MTVWTTPVHVTGVLDVDDWNEQVSDNLTFLHDGVGLYAPGYSDILGTNCPHPTPGAVLAPMMVHDATFVTAVAWRQSSAGGQMDVGIFLDDGNGQTCSRVSTSGITLMPSGSGAKSITLVNSVTLQPLTKYWLVVSFNSANAAITGTDGPISLLAAKAPNAYPLPVVVNYQTGGQTVMPALAAIP